MIIKSAIFLGERMKPEKIQFRQKKIEKTPNFNLKTTPERPSDKYCKHNDCNPLCLFFVSITMTTERTFTTSDICLATSLVCFRHSLISVSKNETKCVFKFQNTPDLQADIK